MVIFSLSAVLGRSSRTLLAIVYHLYTIQTDGKSVTVRICQPPSSEERLPSGVSQNLPEWGSFGRSMRKLSNAVLDRDNIFYRDDGPSDRRLLKIC